MVHCVDPISSYYVKLLNSQTEKKKDKLWARYKT